MYIGDRRKFNMIILLQMSIYWTIGINGLLKIIIPLTEMVQHDSREAHGQSLSNPKPNSSAIGLHHILAMLSQRNIDLKVHILIERWILHAMVDSSFF